MFAVTDKSLCHKKVLNILAILNKRLVEAWDLTFNKTAHT